MDKKTTKIEELKTKFQKLDLKIKVLLDEKKEYDFEFNKVKREIEQLEREFDKDIDEYPIDFEKRHSQLESDKRKLKKSVYVIEKLLYGTFESKKQGLFYKRDNLIDEIKRLSFSSDKKFNEQQQKSFDRAINKINQKIKYALQKYNISIFDESEFLDLELEVIKKAQLLKDESYYQKNDDDAYDEAITFVLHKMIKNRFDLQLTPEQENDYIMELNYHNAIDSKELATGNISPEERQIIENRIHERNLEIKKITKLLITEQLQFTEYYQQIKPIVIKLVIDFAKGNIVYDTLQPEFRKQKISEDIDLFSSILTNLAINQGIKINSENKLKSFVTHKFADYTNEQYRNQNNKQEEIIKSNEELEFSNVVLPSIFINKLYDKIKTMSTRYKIAKLIEEELIEQYPKVNNKDRIEIIAFVMNKKLDDVTEKKVQSYLEYELVASSKTKK